MFFGTIASGSSGNCLYVGDGTTRILVDAGISLRRITEGLSSFGTDPAQIAGVLVTHEHSDHISGLGALSRKYHVPLYMTEGTLQALSGMTSVGSLAKSEIITVRPEDPFDVGGIRVQAVGISHDAASPVCYTFEKDGCKISAATDLGYADAHIAEALSGCRLLYIEANHDLRMLQTGPYPYVLKQRIAGDRGHLCNEACGQLLARIMHPGLSYVVLGHLSKENNYPALALESVIVEAFDDPEDDAVPDIFVAPRDRVSPLIRV